jgi:hypothetical protein
MSDGHFNFVEHVMILLRCAAFLIGALILLFAPPYAMTTSAALRGLASIQNKVDISVALLCIFLFASGFLFVGIGGHRLARTPWKRVTAAVLLSFPLFSCLWVVMFSDYPQLITVMSPMLAFSFALFACFVWPATGRRRRRQMRPREAAVEPVPYVQDDGNSVPGVA